MSTSLLDQSHNFSGWKELLQDLPPMAVAAIAAEALELEKKRPATGQLHFWNAVVDNMLFSAFLAPNLTEDQRKSHLGFAYHIQKFVRTGWGKNLTVLASVEEAWTYSLEQCRGLAPMRDELLERGLVNQSGQLTPLADE